MDIIVDKGCGVDVHKGTVVGCIMGTGIKKEVKTYTTMTNDLLRLKEWLQEAGIMLLATIEKVPNIAVVVPCQFLLRFTSLIHF
jgi:hypothetical protein